MSDTLNDSPAAASAEPADDGYAAAMDAVMNAQTGYARSKAVDRLEQIALARSSTPEGSAWAVEPDAFTPPPSALAYEFVAPPGYEPASEAELGDVRAALFSEGIPREFVGQGYSNLAQLQMSGALASDEAYEAACGKCRDNIQKLHGADAPAMIRDGIAFVDSIARKHPALAEAATAALADPFLLVNAANLQRQRLKRS